MAAASAEVVGGQAVTSIDKKANVLVRIGNNEICSIPSSFLQYCKAISTKPSASPTEDAKEEQEVATMHWSVVDSKQTIDRIITYYQQHTSTKLQHTASSVYVWPFSEHSCSNADIAFFYSLANDEKDNTEDVMGLVHLLNASNFLECTELLMRGCAYAASLVVGRQLVPELHEAALRQQSAVQPEREEQEDHKHHTAHKHHCWALFRQHLSQDVLFLIDRFLPFEAEPFVLLEDKRAFVLDWVFEYGCWPERKSDGENPKESGHKAPTAASPLLRHFFTKEHLETWPTQRLHMLAVDLQHSIWRCCHQTSRHVRDMLLGAFTKYDSEEVDNYVVHILSTLPKHTDVKMAFCVNTLIARHLESGHHARVASLARTWLQQHHPQTTASGQPFLVPASAAELATYACSTVWQTGQNAHRKRHNTSVWPLLQHQAPLAIEGKDTYTCHALAVLAMEEAKISGDMWLVLEACRLFPAEMWHFRDTFVQQLAASGDLKMSSVFARLVNTHSAPWADRIWGTVNGGDVRGTALCHFVLRQPSFWEHADVRAALHQVIHVDFSGNSYRRHRALLLAEITKHGLLEDLRAHLQADEWLPVPVVILLLPDVVAAAPVPLEVAQADEGVQEE